MIHYIKENTTSHDAMMQVAFDLGYANGLKGIKIKSPGISQEEKANYRYGFKIASQLKLK